MRINKHLESIEQLKNADDSGFFSSPGNFIDLTNDDDLDDELDDGNLDGSILGVAEPDIKQISAHDWHQVKGLHHRNVVAENPEDMAIETYTLRDGRTIRRGDTVEILHEIVSLSSSDVKQYKDFLNITAIVTNTHTGAHRLRGYRLRRQSLFAEMFADTKGTNELCLLLRTNDADPRPALEQSIEEIDVDLVIRRRSVRYTKELHRQNNLMTEGFHFNLNVRPEIAIKQVHEEYPLFCRTMVTYEYRNTGIRYGGAAQSLTTNALSILSRQPQEPGKHKGGGNKQRGTHLAHWKRRQLTFGDFFSGAGGASRGAELSGLKVMFGLDKDEHACHAWRKNFPYAKSFNATAAELPPGLVRLFQGLIDIVHFSPPCQAFAHCHTVRGKNDADNISASFCIYNILVALKPRIATMEQTSGLWEIRKNRVYFRKILNQFIRAGYQVRWRIDYACCHGVPQERKRLIFIASRRDIPLPNFPRPTHGSGLKPYVSPYDQLKLLRRFGATHDRWHNPNEQIAIDEEPYNPREGLLYCITTSGRENYHFDGTRGCTVRELAVYQTFPPYHHFEGTVTDARRQVGNGFPPAFAAAVYNEAKKTLLAFDAGLIAVGDDLSTLDDLFDDECNLI